MKHDERQISMFAGSPSGESLSRGDRGGTVPFSLLEKIRGKSPGMRAAQFLALLRIPEGKKAGKPLKMAKFQKSFVKGTFRPGVMVGVLSIGRGNAKTALAAGLALAELVTGWWRRRGEQSRAAVLRFPASAT